MNQTQRMLPAAVLALLLAAVPATTPAGNLLVDAGMEAQVSPAQGGWNLFGGAFSTAQARTGRWSMLDQASLGVVGAYQQFPAAPGSRWQLIGYGMSPAMLLGAPAFGLVQVTFFDALGQDLGTVETAGQAFPAKTSGPVDGGTPVGQWTLLDTGIATAPAGTVFVQAFTLYVDFSGYTQGVFFDDLRLEVLGVTHGQYVSSIARNAASLVRAGLLTEAQAEAMVEAAAESRGGTRRSDD
jgi:hypothetical protein